MVTELKFVYTDRVAKFWRDHWLEENYMRGLASGESDESKPGLRSGRTF
jgi:hypothetical protein